MKITLITSIKQGEDLPRQLKFEGGKLLCMDGSEPDFSVFPDISCVTITKREQTAKLIDDFEKLRSVFLDVSSLNDFTTKRVVESEWIINNLRDIISLMMGAGYVPSEEIIRRQTEIGIKADEYKAKIKALLGVVRKEKEKAQEDFNNAS